MPRPVQRQRHLSAAPPSCLIADDAPVELVSQAIIARPAVPFYAAGSLTARSTSNCSGAEATHVSPAGRQDSREAEYVGYRPHPRSLVLFPQTSGNAT